MGCFWPKYIMFGQKSTEKLHFVTLEYDAKFEEKLTMVWRMTWGIGKFSSEHMKISKLGLSLGPSIQSRKCMRLKLTGELCVTTMKDDGKFEKELTCQFKIVMRNLVNFDTSTQKSQKFTL